MEKIVFPLNEWAKKELVAASKSSAVVNQVVAATRAALPTEDLFRQVAAVVEEAERQHIDLTRGYIPWRNLGFALVDGMGNQGRGYFHTLSAQNPDYDPTECDKQYDACLNSRGSGITINSLFHAAKEAGISAVIAADVAVMSYCNEVGQEVHLSTQLNISNAEALKFYARFADVVVLARELNLKQVREIYDVIQKEQIKGPKGELIRIEMFCHGALCMAVSGKCYLSLHEMNASANRGACMQICRRAYEVKDKDSQVELEVDNKYIMSPKDLKTIHFMDEMIEAGVRVFKIEGRARGPEYVRTVVECYKEAIRSYLEGTFTDEKKEAWDTRLKTVFNRGFWNGYYLGQRLGEWSRNYGSEATERKVYVGKGIRYFSNIGVAEFLVEAAEMKVGDKLLITGPTTGALFLTLDEARVDLKPVDEVKKGQRVSFKVPEKIRPSDKLYKLVAPEELKKK